MDIRHPNLEPDTGVLTGATTSTNCTATPNRTDLTQGMQPEVASKSEYAPFFDENLVDNSGIVLRYASLCFAMLRTPTCCLLGVAELAKHPGSVRYMYDDDVGQTTSIRLTCTKHRCGPMLFRVVSERSADPNMVRYAP